MARRLGPYKAGEIPDPLTYTFKERDGTPIDLTGCTAVVVVKRSGTDAVTLSATVDADQVANRGDVTLTWADGNLATAGSYQLEVWAGDGGDVRLASDTFRFRVERALASPAI